MAGWFNSITNWFDLVLEQPCPLCQRSTSCDLCQTCQKRVRHCQLNNRTQDWQADLPLFAWGRYEGSLKQTIAALKYHQQPKLARPLGHWLAAAWMAAPPVQTRSIVVIPIPMYEAKRRQRGFNQAELIAQAFCQGTGLPLKQQGLVRVRETEAQFNLTATAREQNLASAFQLGCGLSARSKTAVLLIDDIYTTGATARAAVQALQQHRIPILGLAAVAKAGQSINSGTDARSERGEEFRQNQK